MTTTKKRKNDDLKGNALDEAIQQEKLEKKNKMFKEKYLFEKEKDFIFFNDKHRKKESTQSSGPAAYFF